MPPAYEVLLLNTAIPQIQAAQSGDTYVVPRDIAFSAALTLSAGTANGVPYLNGSKVLTSGSALTYNGTTLEVNSGANTDIRTNTSGSGYLQLGQFTNGAFIGTSSSDATAGQLRLGTGGTAQVWLSTSGNLGLGVTPSAWGTVLGLQVRSASISDVGAGANNSNFGSNWYYDGSDFRYISSAAATNIKHLNGAFQFLTAASGTAGAVATFTQAMTLDASGNLGIGETNPSYRLSVKGSAELLADLYSTSAGFNTVLQFRNNNSANGRFGYYNGNFRWSVDNGVTQNMSLTSGGDFVVGTTSGIGRIGAAFPNAQYGFTASCTSASGTAVFNRFLYNTSTEVGTISSTGSSTAYNTSSDYRLKDNPQPLTGSGAFIDALKPKTWDWKSGGKGVGFIAHEVQAVSPGTVVGEKDAVDADGKPIMQAMEYGSAEFIANIIAELQSLRARVKALEGA